MVRWASAVTHLLTLAAVATESAVQAATVQKLEDIILTRAREMRRDALMG